MVTVWALPTAAVPDDFPPGQSAETALASAAQEIADGAIADLDMPGLQSEVIVVPAPRRRS